MGPNMGGVRSPKKNLKIAPLNGAFSGHPKAKYIFFFSKVLLLIKIKGGGATSSSPTPSCASVTSKSIYHLLDFVH